MYKRVKQIKDLPKTKFEIWLFRYWKGFKKVFWIVTDFTFFYRYKDKIDKNMHLILIVCLLGALISSALINGR